MFRFHDNHGKGIELSEDKQTAEKKGDDDKGGIVMSRDPMKVNKLYEVELFKNGEELGWSLAVGAVTSSPDSLTVPDWADGLKSAVIIHWNSVVDHGVKTKSAIGKVLKLLPQGGRVGVSVDCDRALHLHVNGKDQGVVSLRPLPHPSHAFFQLMGPFTKAAVTTTLIDVPRRKPRLKNKAPAFRFHDNHGKNIVLSNKKRTAEKLGDWLDGDGIVMSRDPMEINKLYEIQLTNIREGSEWSPTAGAVTSSPDELDVPGLPHGWQKAVAVDWGAVIDHGRRYLVSEKDSAEVNRNHARYYHKTTIQAIVSIRQSLCQLPVGSRVGVCVDQNRYLHLYVDGQHQGTVSLRSLPEPCFAMFDLTAPCQVTTLPVSEVKPAKFKRTFHYISTLDREMSPDGHIAQVFQGRRRQADKHYYDQYMTHDR